MCVYVRVCGCCSVQVPFTEPHTACWALVAVPALVTWQYLQRVQHTSGANNHKSALELILDCTVNTIMSEIAAQSQDQSRKYSESHIKSVQNKWSAALVLVSSAHTSN